MQADLDRLRHDLATVRAAAGFEPTWNRHAIRTHALLAVAGAAAAVVGAAVQGPWGIAGMATFLLPVADWWWQGRGNPTRTAAADREWREARKVLWYALPLGVLVWWTRIIGLDLATTAGIIWFILGFVLFGGAASERRLRPLFGWAIALMAGGLLTPLFTGSVVSVMGLAISVGALVSAAWIALDLRRLGTQ